MPGAVAEAVKDAMLETASSKAKYISVGSLGAQKTGSEVTTTKVKLAEEHPNNSIILLQKLKGGGKGTAFGLKEGRFYWLKKVAGAEYELCGKEAANPETWEEAITEFKYAIITEIAVKNKLGESKRIATAFEASPKYGVMYDKTVKEFKLPASEPSLLLFYEVEKPAEGELKGYVEVPLVTFSKEEAYNVSEVEWDILATA